MAARFWVGQSGGGNYNSTDWALTTGGTTGQLAPTSSDDVTFDGAGTFGNTACIITATANALTLTFTSGYTSTITLNGPALTLTIAGNFTDRPEHTWNVISTSGSALSISATSTITSNGKTWPGNVSFSGTNTKTLVGDWTITGGITNSGTTTFNKTTAEVMTCGAGLQMNAGMSGTANITITGGTWGGTAGLSTTGTFNFAGSSTINGNVAYSGGTLKYTSGTITVNAGTLTCVASTTFDTNGITFSSISFSGTSQTYTLSSLLSMSGTLTLAGTTTSIFAGTAGFTCATLTNAATAAYAVTLKNSLTYTITTAFTASTTRNGAILSFTSDDGTLKAILTMPPTATCNVLASFTRIDASGGRIIYTFNGVITTCINIISFNDCLPSATGRVSLAGASY